MDIFVHSAHIAERQPVGQFDIAQLVVIRQILFCINMNQAPVYKLVWLRRDGTMIDA